MRSNQLSYAPVAYNMYFTLFGGGLSIDFRLECKDFLQEAKNMRVNT